MPDGATPEGNAFGFTEPPADQAGEPDPFAEEQQPGDQPGQAQPESQPEAQAQPQPQPQDTPPQEGAEETAEEQARRYAGRYETVEDLEQGYRNIQQLQTRTAAERAQLAQEHEQAMAQLAEYEQALQYAMPYIQQAQVSPAQAPTRPQPQMPQLPADFDPSDPQALAQVVEPLVEQRIQERLAETQEQWGQQQQEWYETAQSQAEADAFMADAQAAVDSFREAHPDVEANSPEEFAVAQVMEELDLTPTAAEALEAAYEISRNPSLQQVVRAVPALAQSEEGMTLARRFASLPQAEVQALERAKAANAADAAEARRAAFVETGGAGAPVSAAPGARPKDEVDEMIAEWNRSKSDSIFG